MNNGRRNSGFLLLAAGAMVLVGALGCGGEEDTTPWPTPGAVTKLYPDPPTPPTVPPADPRDPPEGPWQPPPDQNNPNITPTAGTGGYEVVLEQVEITFPMHIMCGMADPSMVAWLVPVGWYAAVLRFGGRIFSLFLPKMETLGKVAPLLKGKSASAVTTKSAEEVAEKAAAAGVSTETVAKGGEKLSRWYAISKNGLAPLWDSWCTLRVYAHLGSKQADTGELQPGPVTLFQTTREELADKMLQVRLTDIDGLWEWTNIPDWDVTLGSCSHKLTAADLPNASAANGAPGATSIQVPCNFDPFGAGAFVPDTIGSTSAFVTVSIRHAQ